MKSNALQICLETLPYMVLTITALQQTKMDDFKLVYSMSILALWYFFPLKYVSILLY